jgi:tetratricopeptide (TPR) repeat protein
MASLKLKKYLPHNLLSSTIWLLSLAVIVGVTYYFYSANQKTDTPTGTVDSSNAAQSESAATNTKLQLDAMASNGNVSGALKAYDNAISGSSDSNVRRDLLISKATVALNNKQYDIALSASQAADVIKSDFNTLSIEAESYDGMGNYAKAIEFYQKAADDTTEFNFDKPFYQSRIEELKKVING